MPTTIVHDLLMTMFDISKIANGGKWIPSVEQGSKWVLVALHGSGGSAENFSGLETIFNIPKLNYLYLNGPMREYANYRWYGDSAESRLRALKYLAPIFDQLIKSGYPPSKIFLMGFSQGAALVFEFGLRYPHLLAGYIAISGRIEDLPSLLHQKKASIAQKGRWLVTHGTKDYNLSVAVMHDQVEKLKKAGLRIDYREYPKIHEFDNRKELPEICSWILQVINN